LSLARAWDTENSCCFTNGDPQGLLPAGGLHSYHHQRRGAVRRTGGVPDIWPYERSLHMSEIPRVGFIQNETL